MSMTAEAYARQLRALLPPGRLWNPSPTGWLQKLLLALSDELARIDARLDALVEEWDPSTAVECLPDWERVLGLPDGTYIPSAVTADRQLQAAAKYGALGGQTPAFFIALAARLLFVATIDEACADQPGAHYWRMDVDLTPSTSPFAVRTVHAAIGSRIGDLVGADTVPELETPVNRAKPAHTIIWFRYYHS